MFPKSPKWLFGHLGTFQSSDSSVNPQGFKMGRPFSCIFLASWSCLCAQYRPWLRTFNSTLHSGNGDSGATDTFLVARCAGECWIRARDLCREITGVSMSPLGVPWSNLNLYFFFSEVVAIHGVRFLEENVCSTAEPPSRLKTEGTVEAAVTWLFVDSRMFEAKAITLRPQVRSQAHVRSAMSVPAMVSCRFSHEPTQ